MTPWKHYRKISRWVAEILLSKGHEVKVFERSGKYRGRPHCKKELAWLVGTLKNLHSQSEYSITMTIDEFLIKTIPKASNEPLS